MSKEEKPEIERYEFKEITYTCPKRGKVTERVKVAIYKSKKIEIRDFVKSADAMINDFDMSELTGDDEIAAPDGEDNA